MLKRKTCADIYESIHFKISLYRHLLSLTMSFEIMIVETDKLEKLEKLGKKQK